MLELHRQIVRQLFVWQHLSLCGSCFPSKWRSPLSQHPLFDPLIDGARVTALVTILRFQIGRTALWPIILMMCKIYSFTIDKRFPLHSDGKFHKLFSKLQGILDQLSSCTFSGQ